MGLGAVEGGEVEVVAGVLEDEFEVGVGGLALDAGGDAGDEGARGMTVPSGTTAPAATMEPVPMRALLRTVAPMPMRTASSSRQPCTVALWPTVQRSPTVTA